MSDDGSKQSVGRKAPSMEGRRVSPIQKPRKDPTKPTHCRPSIPTRYTTTYFPEKSGLMANGCREDGDIWIQMF